MIDLTNKKIGIWGFGLVGKSALPFFTKLGNSCQILDNRTLNKEESDDVAQHNATFLPQHNLNVFLQHNDYILASPGIDIGQYINKANFICELDIFAYYWHKPIIAITGTVGKTTITTILGKILAKQYTVAVGGNIGTPMLDLLENQEEVDLAILECSSWQLEYVRYFRPNIAIITNIYPNHLDRHKTMQNYTRAKLNIIHYQTDNDIAIVPISLQNEFKYHNIASKIIYIDPNYTNFTQSLPTSTFKQNWQIILAILEHLKMPTSLINAIEVQIEHRLELVKKVNNITYYNDSKSTTSASTLAALQQFKDKKVILFLGGLSKGIDRTSLIKQLPKNVKHVICFGKEAKSLSNLCSKHHISTASFDDLTTSFAHCATLAQSDDVVLFSPAGASFDLYTNYKKRGDHFKQMIAKL